MQTVTGVDTEQYPDSNNDPILEPAEQTVDTDQDTPAISKLAAAAEDFNAAFNTALYELESSRRLLKERSTRIAELDESITTLNTSLQEQVDESRRKDEAYAAETQTLGESLRELETRRDSLSQQVAEQQQTIEAQAREITGLNVQVSELKATLEQQREEARQAAEAHTREAASAHAALQQNYDTACEESTRLQGELDVLNTELRTREEQLQQSTEELESRATEIASLGVIHGELTAHVEKLENLNRALHDSSVSENEVHRKVIAEKDAAIAALKIRLEAAKHSPSGATDENEAGDKQKTTVQQLEARLQESEAQAQSLAERAEAAGQLRAQVEALTRELQAVRVDGGASAASLPALELSLESEPVRPNSDRESFVGRLNELLALPADKRSNHTLMYILLDNFMRVRDEIGVLNTAQVIDETFAIIESCCRDNCIISRFGDCTFAVLCVSASTDEVQTKAECIRSTIEQNIFEVDGRTLVTSTSIGVCALRGSDTDSEQVISRADLACESARLSGGNQVVMNSAVSDELSLPEGDSRAADIVDHVLTENRLKIYYQPISNLKQNTIDYFEVLTRVVDENDNVILPGEFFAMAANSGKAVEVDRHVIECVLRKLAEEPKPDMKLFIKLTRQSVSTHDLPVWISNKLDEYRIHPGQLVFEVPEQAMESDLKSLSQLSRELNKIGCRIAVEHYRMETQPQHLRHIHPEYLKIDHGLVQNINKKGPCLAKVNEILDLAKMNNLKTIAEGVETPACLAILWELGVTLAQGYLISEPIGQATSDTSNVDSGYQEQHGGKAVFQIS